MKIRIAIDGPSGAGKSSVAKQIAQKLHILYVDTGALYRALALAALDAGIDPAHAEAVEDILPRIDLQVRYKGEQKTMLNGVCVNERIRSPEVSMAASAVSAHPAVRAFLLDTQRRIAEKNSVIMDGRDIGTVILPHADLKIFLSASPHARAKRRCAELLAKGILTTEEEVLADMERRDENDRTRAVAPCVPAPDAILLDNSDMTLEQTAEKIEEYLRDVRRRKKDARIYMRTWNILAPLVRLFFHVKVQGRENIPCDGGVLVCANHIAVRDVFILGSVFTRPIRFLAKKELFDIPLLGSLIRVYGAVRLDRGGADVGAIRTSVSLAKAGEAVAIFPQGHRYPGINPAQVKPLDGAALIAYRAKTTVLPICLKTKGVKYAPFRRVTVCIGKPIAYDELGFEHGGKSEYAAVTDRIWGEILKLGAYTPLPATGEHVQAEEHRNAGDTSV